MKNKIIVYSSLLIIGLLMGPFSSYLFMNVLHIPFVAPELVFIPFFFLLYKKLGISFDGKVSFFGVIAIWMFFLIVAFLWSIWDYGAILSTARSFLILGIFYAIGLKIRFDDSLSKILLLCSIGSLIGWLIQSILNVQAYMLFLGAHDESVVYGNMIAIAFAFSISLLMRSNYITFLLVFAINVFISFTSSLRRQISVSILSLLLSVGMVSLKNRRINYLILIGIVSIPIYIAMPQIEQTVADISPNIHYRVFERTQDMLEGNFANGDQGRYKHQFIIFEDFLELIIPHGFVSQHTGKHIGTGVFNDVPMYMLSYSFGVITLLIYSLYYIARLRFALVSFIKKGNSYYGVIFVVGAVMFFLHFVESTMFTVSYTAPFTGLTFGLLFRKRLSNNVSKYKI